MGVTSLWDVLGPVSRPVRLESLSKKRMAVDASIWVYQFLKAVRDKDGNSLNSAHIVGFFRRICKLLYFGIFPVFVFDGGVPVLKRKTIAKRRERREGAKESTEEAARRILTMQLQRLADGYKPPVAKSTNTPKITNTEGEGEFTEYFEDNDYMDPRGQAEGEPAAAPPKRESISQKTFRRQDEYHLPEIKSFEVAKDDKRIITDYEYKRLTGDIWEDMDGIDLDSIDPTSAEFEELPLEMQYVIISHLRLRSRLRMGYTKEQLESLFPNSMDFSRFQIQMVQKRNFFTQKLMNSTGMDGADATKTRRIAGEQDRAYTLEKSEDGWTLSLKNAGTKNKPIQLDEYGEIKEHSAGEEEEEEESWEDVPLKPKENVWSASPVQSANPSFGSMRSFVDPSVSHREETAMEEIPSEGEVELVESESEDEDTKRAMIESLYDLASRRKREREREGTTEASEPPKEVSEADEEEQMRAIIEKSKREYLDLLKREKQISEGKDVELGEAKGQPFIFSKLDFKNTILAKKDSAPAKRDSAPAKSVPNSTFPKPVQPATAKSKGQKVYEPKTSVYEPDFDEEKSPKPVRTKPQPKAQPMPEWFGGSRQPGREVRHMAEQRTADEEAGLIAFPNMAEYASESDEEEDVEFIDLDDEVEELGEVKDVERVFEIPDKGEEEKEKPVNREIEEADEKKTVTDQRISENSSEKETAEPANENTEQPSGQTASELLSKSEGQPSGLLPDKDAVIGDFMFLDSEEEQMEDKLQDEEANFEDFVNNIGGSNAISHATPQWILDKDAEEFRERRRKQNRDSDEVTSTMIDDVQELLRRFGIPYITSPMEAEAQCAELHRLGLVDGIITDDSDCFLFGGGKVYRNMFSEKNFVECYYLDDIERDLGLPREKLIQLALLLGSDYTEGIKGVGIVTAMEILAEFQEGQSSDALVNFRDWWMDYQNGKIQENESTIRRQLRKKFKNKLFLNEQFPDPLVSEGYMHPEVDHDKTEFQWGTADLERLRTFLMVSVGWNQDKVDEILVPVIRNMNKQKKEGLQSTMGEFFPNELLQRRKELAMGKRLKRASEKLSKKQKTT